MGFMSFGAAALLGIFAVIRMAEPTKKGEQRLAALFKGTLWYRVVLVLAALFLYAEFVSQGGYLLTTFILMTFLFWIVERKKIWMITATSLVTTVLTYYVFSKWLNCQFPAGPWGF